MMSLIGTEYKQGLVPFWHLKDAASKNNLHFFVDQLQIGIHNILYVLATVLDVFVHI